MFEEEVNFSLILEEFIYELKIQNYSKRTAGTYFYNVRLFVEYLKEQAITEYSELRTVHLKEFVNYLQAKGYKSNYINVILKSVRAFFNYLVKEQYISTNPMNRIKFLKEDREVIHTFTEKEVARLLSVYSFKNYLEARNKLIIAFFVDTGMRLTELIKLQEDWIEDSVIRVFGKGSKWRYVPISPQLKKLIIRYQRIRQGYFERIGAIGGNFFLSRSGKELTPVMVQLIVKKAGKKARVREEIRCSPHTFRHYAIQSYLKQGLDVYSVSKLVGHENISVTNRYLLGLETEDIVERASYMSPMAHANKQK